MKIFVAFGYNSRDQWIRDLVIPMIRAFHLDVVTGERTYLMGAVPAEVVTRIKACDALVGFTTRREKGRDTYWTTHHWVIQEMGVAMGYRLPTVEVRETEVDPQLGMGGSLEPIVYEEGRRDECLVKIAQAIGNVRFSSFEVQLLIPEVDLDVLGPLARQGSVHCWYRYRDGFYQSEEISTDLVPITGGLFAVIKSVPHNALIKFRLEAHGRQWNSVFESMGSTIQLR